MSDSEIIEIYLREPGQPARHLSCVPVEMNPDETYFLLSRYCGSPGSFRVIEERPVDICEAGFPAVSRRSEAFEPVDPDYERKLSGLIASLEGRYAKTVISRVSDCRTECDALTIFGRLCRLYPAATVYAWQDNDCFWIGATPEILVEYRDKRLSSMALAGTRPAGTPGPWDEKNIKEQKIVAEYILEEFKSHGLDADVSRIRTRNAGPVEHIESIITATEPVTLSESLNIASCLSPTPAVAGYPRREAMENIACIEPHDREFYGGYFGLVENNRATLYVTLRCIKLFPSGRVRIYAGGGITGDSHPCQEWEETCRKASTLLNVIH